MDFYDKRHAFELTQKHALILAGRRLAVCWVKQIQIAWAQRRRTWTSELADYFSCCDQALLQLEKLLPAFCGVGYPLSDCQAHPTTTLKCHWGAHKDATSQALGLSFHQLVPAFCGVGYPLQGHRRPSRGYLRC